MEIIELSTLIMAVASILLYLISFVLTARKQNGISMLVMIFAWISNFCIFIINWTNNGYVPMASMYQVLTLLSLCFIPLFYLMVYFDKQHKWLLPYFQIASIIPIFGTLFMDKEIKWELVPALQSIWFVPHIFSYMISYSLAGVAFILTIQYLITGRKKIEMEQAVYSIMRISFPFMTIGILFGSLWAEEVWGAFWSWDIKEIWSLITWLFYLCYFHARRVEKYRKASTWFIVFAFAALIITFIFLNILPKMPDSLHTYTS